MALSNIMTTCRSLQSLIAPSTQLAHSNAAPSSGAQLPTPPMTYAPLPMKLRLQTGPSHSDSSSISANRDLYTRRKIHKRHAIPRAANKRHYVDMDDFRREHLSSGGDGHDSDVDVEAAQFQHQQSHSSWLDNQQQERSSPCAGPSTPKRARIAPEQMPFGLARSDFHNMYSAAEPASANHSAWGTDVEIEADGNKWSVEDDRLLIELVLDKLKLSKSEWQDCARNLGKDRQSVNRRWKSLIVRGDVGAKTCLTRSRARLHSTCR
ncbi:hypothetical protein E4U21_007630 [Claviceps maximensis]|nr:hypothetical protein E4U21_007630 [Claviceps maximensis]